MTGAIDLDAVRTRARRCLRLNDSGGRTADFIASATDVPALVDEVERLRALLDLATEFTVNASHLPPDDPERDLFDVLVIDRGDGRWSVSRSGGQRSLNAEGLWDWESIPSERREEWLAAHRFERDEALRRARLVAPDVMVNGVRAGDAR